MKAQSEGTASSQHSHLICVGWLGYGFDWAHFSWVAWEDLQEETNIWPGDNLQQIYLTLITGHQQSLGKLRWSRAHREQETGHTLALASDGAHVLPLYRLQILHLKFWILLQRHSQSLAQEHRPHLRVPMISGMWFTWFQSAHGTPWDITGPPAS